MHRACLAREPTAIRTFPGPTLTRKRGPTTSGQILVERGMLSLTTAGPGRLVSKLADHGTLLEAVPGEPGRIMHAVRRADECIVIRAHLVVPPPARTDPDLLQKRQTRAGNRGQRLDRLLAAAERETAALPVEVEAGREIDRERQLGGQLRNL